MKIYTCNTKRFRFKLKMAVTFMLIPLFQIYAISTYSQDAKITLKLKEISLEKALLHIEYLTPHKFLYNDKEIDYNRLVSINETNKPVSKILHKLFNDKNVSFKLFGEQIVLKPSPVIKQINTVEKDLSVQQQIITGNITDENNQPMPGVNVIEKGTKNGVTTDFDGKYSIKVSSDNAVLVFSFIGFQIEERKVENNTSINISMIPESSKLGEVVIVGYGTQKKENLTGAVTSVKSESVTRRSTLNISTSLQGVAAGVTVTPNSGKPGSSATVQIRGVGTLGNSNPLVLIDGVQVENGLNAINPNDIENMSILKDAAASAIYGARAANGVILITTKRMNKEGLIVSYRGTVGQQVFTNKPKFARGLDYINAFNTATLNANTTQGLFSPQYIENYKKYKGKDGYSDTDWQEEFFKGTGIQQQHNVSIRAGSKLLKSTTSFVITKQDGNVSNYDFYKFNFRTNNDYLIRDNMTLSTNINLRRSRDHTPWGGVSRVFYVINHYAPIDGVRLSNGKYALDHLGNINPLGELLDRGFNNITRTNAYVNFKLNYKPIKGVDINVTYTPEYEQTKDKAYQRPYEVYPLTINSNGEGEIGAVTLSKGDSGSVNELIERGTEIWKNTFQAVGSYSANFNQHYVSLLGGYEQIDYTTKYLQGYRRNFVFPDYHFLNAGSLSGQQSEGGGSQWALKSFFTRFSYNWKKRYFFEANLRYDGSSRFLDDKQYGVFPAFSGAWRVSEEPFFKSIEKTTKISNLKFRGSWGQLGNQNVGSSFYPAVSPVNFAPSRSYVFGDQPVAGSAVASLANKDLTWENAESLNGAVELGFLKDKITATFEMYKRETTNILMVQPVSRVVGLESPFVNGASVENKGWEFSMTYRGLIGDLKYSITGNLSDVDNKITNLNGVGPIFGENTIRKVGHPVDAYYGFISDGLYQSDEEVKLKQLTTNVKAGDIRYKDLNNDGEITQDDDRKVIGNPIPRYTYALNFNLEYRKFDLSVFLQGVGKRDALLVGDASYSFYNGGSIQEYMLNAWSPENKSASYPRLISGSNHSNFNVSNFWMYNGAYVRIKNITLGYTFENAFIERIKISNLRLFFTGDNVFTISHMPDGWDPEYQGTTPLFYPTVSTYTLGLNISF